MSVRLFIALMGILLIVLILILFWHPQRSRTKTSTSANSQRTDAVFRDDDQYWYRGVFYNNPDDPYLFVPKRFGLGWTMNFGHPQARLVIIGTLVVFLVLGILTALISGTAPNGCHTFGCHPS